MRWIEIYAGAALLLCGCATDTPPAVVDEADTMLHLGANLRLENLLFPDYLFMADFELDQHGRIPESSRVGVGLKTKLGLQTVFRRFNDVLTIKDWETTVLESKEQAFRLWATRKGDVLEIRAVQGTGPTQVFILYEPRPEDPVAD
jgi:hypothetical protein